MRHRTGRFLGNPGFCPFYLLKPHLRSAHPYLLAPGFHKPSKMLTKYLTSVSATFTPFNARSGKTARNFLALLPPNARSTMSIDIKMLGKEAAVGGPGKKDPARLALKFSMCTPSDLVERGRSDGEGGLGGGSGANV